MAASEGDEADLLNNDDGYKAPEKRTLDELVKLDAEDESLQRYKESLLGGTNPVNPCRFSSFTFIFHFSSQWSKKVYID